MTALCPIVSVLGLRWNEWLDAESVALVFRDPVVEGFVSSYRLQVVRVSVDDLRPGLRIVLPPSRDVHIKNSKRLSIG